MIAGRKIEISQQVKLFPIRVDFHQEWLLLLILFIAKDYFLDSTVMLVQKLVKADQVAMAINKLMPKPMPNGSIYLFI